MKNKKIGIVTLFNCYNYGAVLQAYATYEYLNKIGFKDVEIINYENKYEATMKRTIPFIFRGSIKDTLKKLIQFIIFGKNRHLKKGFTYFTKSLKKSNIKYKNLKELKESNYDILVSGSDQIWNPVIFNKLDLVFLLNFSKTAKKISISSSAGSYTYSEEEIDKVSKCLNEFSAISVREKSLKSQLQSFVNKDIFVSVDPTLLLTKEEWTSKLVSENKYNESNSKYILLYIVDANLKTYEKEIKTIKERLDMPIWIISPYKYKMKNIDRNIVCATPNDFISLFKNANYIITNSYHGVIFSTNFKKKFVALENHKNPVRTNDYLTKVGLTERIIKNNEEAKKIKLKDYDYSYFQKLNSLVNETKEWIGDNLIGKY